ncbi:MAG: hypothetical protein C0501_21305 [Isosphaera sp.]|nr:hypothetical protein [Isosphaera sp.]
MPAQGQSGYFPPPLFLPPKHDIRNRTSPEYLDYFHNVLCPDVKKRGIVVPRLAHREGDRLRTIDGWTGILAALMVGLDEVPAIVYPAPLSDDDAKIASWQANAKRLDMTVAERARFYTETLAARGWTQAQLCRELNLDKCEVSRTLSKYKALPPEVMKDVGGKIPSRGGDVLVKLVGHPEVMHQYADDFRAERISVEDAEEKAARFLAAARGEKPRKARRRRLNDGGVSVEFPADLAPEQIQAKVADILKKLRKGA